VSKTVRVNPIACEAHGLCAELLPERIRLDEWGYPIVDPTPVAGEVERHARRAVAACPTLALLLVDAAAEAAENGGRRATGGRAAERSPRRASA
jgi:ferredoxin